MPYSVCAKSIYSLECPVAWRHIQLLTSLLQDINHVSIGQDLDSSPPNIRRDNRDVGGHDVMISSLFPVEGVQRRGECPSRRG